MEMGLRAPARQYLSKDPATSSAIRNPPAWRTFRSRSSRRRRNRPGKSVLTTPCSPSKRRDRQVVEWFYFDGLSHQEIGRRLAATTKSRLQPAGAGAGQNWRSLLAKERQT